MLVFRMSLDEVVKLLEQYDLKIRKLKSSVKAFHTELPIGLQVTLRKKSAIVEMIYSDELREVLEDLYESGEDVEALVDDTLSELRDIAIDVSRLLEEKGYKVNLKIKEGENDIRDILEDFMEEYPIYEEE